MPSVFDTFNNPEGAATAQPGPSVFDQFNVPGDHPFAKQSPDAWRYINGLVEAAARGASGGLIDKGAALGDAAVLKLIGDNRDFGQIYTDRLNNYRQRSDEFAEAAPVASKVAYGTGLVGSGLALAPEAAATTIGKVAQGAKLGGGYGAASGAAQAEDNFWDLVKGTGEGAAAGAVTGAVLPPALSTLGGTIKTVASKVFPGLSASDGVNRLTTALLADASAAGKSPQDYARYLSDRLAAAPNVPLTIADVAGDNTRALVGQSLRAQGGEEGSRFLSERSAGAGQRVVSAINQNLLSGSRFHLAQIPGSPNGWTVVDSQGQKVFGSMTKDRAQQTIDQLSPKSAYRTIDQLDAQAATDAGPLYTRAFQNNQSISSPILDDILDTKFGKDAFKYAQERASNQMTRMGVPDSELGDLAREQGINAPGGVAEGLKLKSWDWIKQAMDDQIGQLRRQVGTGAARAGEFRDAVSLKNQFVNELDRLDTTAATDNQGNVLHPGLYKQARQAYAGPARMSDAVEEGQGFMGDEPEEISAKISGMGDAEKQAYYTGIADTLRKGVYRQGAGPTVQKLGTDLKPEMKMKLEAAGIPDADAFLSHMEGEATAASTGKSLASMPPEQHGSVIEPVVQLGMNAAEGHVPGMILNAGRTIGRLGSGNRISSDMADQIRQLTLTPPSASARDILAGALNNTSRSRVLPAIDITAGSLAGRSLPDFAQSNRAKLIEAISGRPGGAPSVQ